MQDYVSLPFGQHMAFLVKALGGTPGEVAEPVLPPLTATANARLIKAATAFLHHIKLAIEPRTHWPDEGMPRYAVRGFIAPAHQAEPGRALCVWGTAGWGSLVQQGKYQKGYFCDKLIAACVNMIGKWKPQPGPTWVTCIPSRRYPHLVPQFAQRLALALNLPFHDVITKTDASPEQKTMENSTQQARNIDGSLALDRQSVLPGPVLLVDDMVNSR